MRPINQTYAFTSKELASLHGIGELIFKSKFPNFESKKAKNLKQQVSIEFSRLPKTPLTFSDGNSQTHVHYTGEADLTYDELANQDLQHTLSPNDYPVGGMDELVDSPFVESLETYGRFEQIKP